MNSMSIVQLYRLNFYYQFEKNDYAISAGNAFSMKELSLILSAAKAHVVAGIVGGISAAVSAANKVG